MNKLELLSPADAHSEKKLAAIKKTIVVSENGIRRSGAQMFGYAYIQGSALLEAKGIVPHGKFMQWCEQNFPEIADRAVNYRMSFATEVNAKFATVANLKSATVADLKTAKLIGNGKKISKKDEETLLKVIPEVMEGKGIMEFMRAAKFQRDPKPDGGYRPNNAAVQEWLKEFHPDLAGTKYDDLPAKIQKEYRSYVPPLDPAVELAILESSYSALEHELGERVIDNKTFVALSHQRMTEFRTVLFDALNAVDEVLNKAKKR